MKPSTHEITKSEKKSRAAETGTPVMVRLQSELLALVDGYRRRQVDLPNRPEAIRRMVEIAARGGR